MAFSRRLGVVSILSACWLVGAVGCSDDEDRKNNSGEAGEGGDDGGGKGGTPSGGGNSNNGGNAGNGGSSIAGDAGSGGTAGDAGSGSGGDAGSGGIVAGAGGEGGEGTTPGGGQGGQAIGGAGGEGGDAAAPVAKSCVDVCESADDCVDGGGYPRNCNDVTNVCEECAVDADCGPQLAEWIPGCETTEECGDSLFVCVDYRGNPYCAILDDPQNQLGCTDLGEYEPTTATLREGGADVSVCILTHTRCLDASCKRSCEASTCPAKEGDTCNPVSGRCECQNSTECGTGLVCVDNLCTECAVDNDCASNVFGNNKCVAGKCGCGDATSCVAELFPDASEACQ